MRSDTDTQLPSSFSFLPNNGLLITNYQPSDLALCLKALQLFDFVQGAVYNPERILRNAR